MSQYIYMHIIQVLNCSMLFLYIDCTCHRIYQMVTVQKAAGDILAQSAGQISKFREREFLESYTVIVYYISIKQLLFRGYFLNIVIKIFNHIIIIIIIVWILLDITPIDRPVQKNLNISFWQHTVNILMSPVNYQSAEYALFSITIISWARLTSTS